MNPLRWMLLLALLVIGVAGMIYVSEPNWYLRLRYPLAYPNFIRAHAANYDLPPELVAAVIYQESSFEAAAKSSAGAVGLMQLTPDTAKGIASRTGGHRFQTSDLLDPEINIRYGCWYLDHMRERFAGKGQSFDLALAAYNAGQGRVAQWIREDDDGQLEVDEIPFAETRAYVRRVNMLTEAYRNAYPVLQEPVSG